MLLLPLMRQLLLFDVVVSGVAVVVIINAVATASNVIAVVVNGIVAVAVDAAEAVTVVFLVPSFSPVSP